MWDLVGNPEDGFFSQRGSYGIQDMLYNFGFSKCAMIPFLSLIATLYAITHLKALVYEPHCEKTGLRGFRPGPTQTRRYNHTRWLEA